MALLIGTGAGIFRAEGTEFDDAERVLESGRTSRIRSFDGFDGVFAAGVDGLYRSTDGGRTWQEVSPPETRAWAVFAAGDERLYAGTQPAHLYYTTDGGESWSELESVRRQTTVSKWRCAYGPDARVRTVTAHPEAPERLFVGIEAGGLYRSEDAGETWAKCAVRDAAGVVQDDIHHAIALSPREYVVACGRLSIHDPNHAAAEGGLYRTTDAGASWRRLDTDLAPSYYRTVFREDGTLYACGTTTVPPEWTELGAEATMFTSSDGGNTFETVRYPGHPDEVVLAWEASEDLVLGGTAAGDRGRVIVRDGHAEWRTAGFVPADVHAIHAC